MFFKLVLPTVKILWNKNPFYFLNLSNLCIVLSILANIDLIQQWAMWHNLKEKADLLHQDNFSFLLGCTTGKDN